MRSTLCAVPSLQGCGVAHALAAIDGRDAKGREVASAFSMRLTALALPFGVGFAEAVMAASAAVIHVWACKHWCILT
jgi:hypothetical protein